MWCLTVLLPKCRDICWNLVCHLKNIVAWSIKNVFTHLKSKRAKGKVTSNFIVCIVNANVAAPWCARTSGGNVISKFWSRIYTRLALQGINLQVMVACIKAGATNILVILQLNSSKPSGAFIWQPTGSLIIHKMHCRLLGSTPLTESVLQHCELNP